MTDIGSPFQENSRHLLSLDTNYTAHHTATKWINILFEKGKPQFNVFWRSLRSYLDGVQIARGLNDTG